MYEAYVATLVGVVCGAAAVAALQFSRNLSAAPYAAVHLVAILVMIVLVTLGYDSMPLSVSSSNMASSRMLYILVSWVLFIATMWTYRLLSHPDLKLES
jgi:protein-S-isoprenylcysteine O-methyltransferase Ste14